MMKVDKSEILALSYKSNETSLGVSEQKLLKINSLTQFFLYDSWMIPSSASKAQVESKPKGTTI